MMDNIILIIGSLFVFAVISIIIVLNVIQKGKKQKIKKLLEKLEYEKNIIDGVPIAPELTKVESFLKNDKLEILYKDWKERLGEIKADQIPKITDMLIEADHFLNQMDYKSIIYKIAKLEMEIYKVRANSDVLLSEIKEITNSEEKNRAIATNLKSEYRNIYQEFKKHEDDCGEFAKYVLLQFENIAKRFEDFETVMDNNDYTEVTKLLNAIDEMLKHMKVVVEEVPAIALLTTNIIPKRINDIEKEYNLMIKQGYPLDYLNVEYNINEANKKINDIMDRCKVLNLEDSLLELKVLMDYFDGLFNDFEKEHLERKKYEDNNIEFRNKINKTNTIINEIFSQLSDIKNIYNLSKEDVENLNIVKSDLSQLNKDYKVLISHTSNKTFAFSKLTSEIEALMVRLSAIEDKLDNFLNAIGSMRDDEVRARQQLEEIKSILKDAKLKLRDYSLPTIPSSYFMELKETNAAIKEIIKELDKKPITVEVLNTRVDTARDLVLKLYGKTKDMLKIAMFSEMTIVYGNRYRSKHAELNKALNTSEKLFFDGEYQKSLEISINALNKIEQGIYDKLLKLYGN